MNEERQADHFAHSVLVANLLDDPRWEKLALGTASPEEIETLRDWAQHSHIAREAWDLFRPAMEKEKAAITIAVQERLASRSPIVDTQIIFLDKQRRNDVRAKLVDSRMMFRHAFRVPGPTSYAPVSEAVSSPVSATATHSTLAKCCADLVAPTYPQDRCRSTSRLEACEVTSRSRAECNGATDMSSHTHTGASTRRNSQVLNSSKPQWDPPWFVAAALALFVMVDMFIFPQRNQTLTTQPSTVPTTAATANDGVVVRQELDFRLRL